MSSLRHKLRSDIWYHFIKTDGGTKGQCNYCLSKISICANSSSNLKRHLKLKHPTVQLHVANGVVDRSGSPSTGDESRENYDETICDDSTVNVKDDRVGTLSLEILAAKHGQSESNDGFVDPFGTAAMNDEVMTYRVKCEEETFEISTKETTGPADVEPDKDLTGQQVVEAPQTPKSLCSRSLKKNVKRAKTNDRYYPGREKIPPQYVNTQSGGDCQSFGIYVADKLRNYSMCTRSYVQHAISEIIFSADQGQFERNCDDYPIRSKGPRVWEVSPDQSLASDQADSESIDFADLVH